VRTPVRPGAPADEAGTDAATRVTFLTVLRGRPFRLVWLAQAISEAGDALASMALLLLVTTLSDSPLAISVLMFCQLVPVVVVGPLAGVLVDRWDRKSVLILSDLVRAALWLTLALRPGLGVMCAVAFLSTSASLFFGPARRAIIPEVVGEAGITAAVGLSQTTTQILNLIGPSLGGALAGLIGVRALFALDSATFIGSAVVLGMLSLPPELRLSQGSAARVPPGAPARSVRAFERFWTDLAAGIRFLRGQATLSFIVILLAGISGVMRMAGVAQIDYLRNVLSLDPTRFGLLMTLGAVGAVAGSVLTGNLGAGVRKGRVLGWSLAGAVASFVPFLWRPGYGTVLALTVVGNVLGSVYAVLLNSIFLTRTPLEVRGRVFAASGALTNGFGLVTVPLAGFVVAWLGSALTIGAVGLLALAVTALALTGTRGGRALLAED